MSRGSRTLLLTAAIAVAAAAIAYFGAMQLCARQVAGPDDLAWLKREFRLSDNEMARIRQLHEGYLPKCREMCAKIAAKRSEVDTALAKGEVPDARMIELATLRAQCQAQMLKHFQDVSRTMAPEQGSRYLAQMQRLTLGFHQTFESSMGETSGHSHGEH